MLTQEEKDIIIAEGKAPVKVTFEDKKQVCHSITIKRGENNTGTITECGGCHIYEGYTVTNFSTLREGGKAIIQIGEGAPIELPYLIIKIEYLV